MVKVIRKSDSKETGQKKLGIKKLNRDKGFDADKYCGIISWDINPLEYQQKSRQDRIESAR